MGREIIPNISEKELALMELIISEGTIKHKYAVRVQTVINRAKGRTTNDTAAFLGININTVSRYVIRYNNFGLDSLLQDKTRKPGTKPISNKVKDEITQLVCKHKPENATHWSTRELAKEFGISHTAVNTILRERGLKPHIVKKFQLSNDPDFESKLKDVVGLYLNPPENAIILCVDEKTQIQALERTQPILPLLPGVPERQTHDYYRHGTTTLFAALNVASGKIIGDCKGSHRGSDYMNFLKLLDKKTPKDKVLHIIADNYSAHKSPTVREYLDSKKGRFVEHFIPTYSSWLNLIERWFAEITNKRIRRESWNSVLELEKAITDYITSWNNSGNHFTWTKTFDELNKSIKKVSTRD
jgi:transposase